MKKGLFFITLLIFSILFIPVTNVYAQGTDSVTNNNILNLNNSKLDISIDGYADDWNDKPASYEYSWDNSANCWYNGVWIDGECYKTDEGTYSTDVRNKIQLFTDKENVYLHITFAKNYDAMFNGEDYNFTFNVNGKDQSTKFQVTTLEGETITYRAQELFTPGIHEVLIKHGTTQYSGLSVEGSMAYIYVPEDYRNIQLEFQIPYDQFIVQNSNIDIKDISSISFFTPNLMYRSIVTEGSPTGFGITIIIAAACSSLYFIRRRKNAKIL